MIKNVLTDIGGIGLYGVISLCLFGLVFLVAGVRMLMLKKSDLQSLETIPFEDGTRTPEDSEINLNQN